MAATLTKTRIRAGHWEGILTGVEGTPEVEVDLLGMPLPGVTLTPRPEGGFSLRLPIPAEVLNEGVQTFLIRQKGGEVLAHFTIITGVAMDDDLRAEVDLLRAELDMLKAAFRRHCVGQADKT